MQIQTNTYEYIPNTYSIHTKYMPIHTCYSYGFRPRLYSGLVCIGMYLVCNGMYWFVYYKHNTDQYWPNGTTRLRLYWFVFVCNGMYCLYLHVQPLFVCKSVYCGVLKCIGVYWHILDSIICIYWWSASKLHFRMIRRPLHCLCGDAEICTSRSWFIQFVLTCIDPYCLYLLVVCLLLCLLVVHIHVCTIA